jgi:acyl-coenzyme A synthetase/AMP-(fatty) acid ligase
MNNQARLAGVSCDGQETQDGGKGMPQSKWLTAGRVMALQTVNCPDRIAVKDKVRQLTFKEWNERANALSNTLAAWVWGMGTDEPGVAVDAAHPWMIMYTSGTTGKPKGVVRNHEATMAEWLMNVIDFGFKPDDKGLLVMPMCHINSVFYSFVFTYIGASCYICNLVSFDPEEILRIMQEEKIAFVSLVPTHCTMILAHPDSRNYDVSSMRNVLCSSAPVRTDAKLSNLIDNF